jgi:hypothetical protein
MSASLKKLGIEKLSVDERIALVERRLLGEHRRGHSFDRGATGRA